MARKFANPSFQSMLHSLIDARGEIMHQDLDHHKVNLNSLRMMNRNDLRTSDV